MSSRRLSGRSSPSWGPGRTTPVGTHGRRPACARQVCLRNEKAWSTATPYPSSVSQSAAVDLLRDIGVNLTPGLSDTELMAAQTAYGVKFGVDHREFLSEAVPVGDQWFNWRNLDDDHVRRAVSWPLEGVLFDVEADQFWPASWGEKPPDESARREMATTHVGLWPQLVPLYGHRYLPAAPHGTRAPVFSVYQTDVIVYGVDLIDYLHREFHNREQLDAIRITETHLPPWTLFALGRDIP